MPSSSETQAPHGAHGVAITLALGYAGIYLCRQNFAVANPMLQEALGASKAEVGAVASFGTLAYMLGKFISGPAIDRIGGRRGFLIAMSGVALFGGLGALSPGLAALSLLYAANRFLGAGGWGAMMKLASSWFPARRLATAIGALSLSYIIGAIAAKQLAAMVAAQTGDWRWVMGLPSLPVLLLMVLVAVVVRPGPLRELPAGETLASVERVPFLEALGRLLRRRAFLVICALALVLTFLRDAFHNWSVDFIVTTQPDGGSVATAALYSLGFEVGGAITVIALGAGYDRLSPRARRRLFALILLALGVVIALLGMVGARSPVLATGLLLLAGMLLYGPFSILGPMVALESGGTDLASTANGIVDGVSYLAAILAGAALGALLDAYGYPLAFGAMAGLSLLAAGITLALPVEAATSTSDA